MAEKNAWREARITDLTRQIDSLESEIQIASRSNISTHGVYQVKKRLLKARKKIIEESLDRIGTHQCVCNTGPVKTKGEVRIRELRAALTFPHMGYT